MSETDENLDDIPTDTDTENASTEGTTESKTVDDDHGEELLRGEEEESYEEESSEYDFETTLSRPKLSKHCTMPEDILDFHFSYGYSCRKYFNLTVLDGDTIVFASGNFINFFSVKTREIWFRRTILGGGIGHIRKNPNPEYPHFAVAESGRKPIIILYEWPSLDIVNILKGGASKVYANMDFSPDGELLVSQSGEPDYLITVWNWRDHHILLRNKSYVNDVYRVKFSPYVPGQITTCGLAHIKFWKMASTFTGLKLKGELGRFGRTEYSDIYGVLPMPDEKVVSGCSWGNILVWDEGLITLEIFRSLRRKCHDAPIVQFHYEEGELWSISMDGHVKCWWYEKIDQADPSDDDRVVLIDPSYDFYTPGLMLYCIERQYPHDPTSSWYFAQDGNGGIWLIDLNTDDNPKPSILLYKCHAGEVVDIDTCPFGPYLASFGVDGRIYLYNYEKKSCYSIMSFRQKIVPAGDILLAAFDDGQIRVLYIDLNTETDISLSVIQITKPHNKSITKMSVNPNGTILVSASEDCTIFIFKMQTSKFNELLLIPIGFIPAPDVVTCITWNPLSITDVLIGCLHGQMIHVSNVPSEPQLYTEVSYLLKIQPKNQNFTTYKAQIRRDIKIREIEARKAVKVAKKRKEMEQIKKDNPGLEIDEEVYLADSESEEELEPLFIPETPNKILWLQYTDEGTIWVSMGGYDAGYIYEYMIDQIEDIPFRFKMIDDADDTEISSYVYSHNKDYLIFAMQDGSIRVNKVKKADFRDLSDYWKLSMHDNQNGYVPKMCFSYDEGYFFSCGHDGNIFAYRFRPEWYRYPDKVFKINRFDIVTSVKDVDGYNELSMEDKKIKAENDRKQKVANEHKVRVRETLKTLKEHYAKILLRNSKLLSSQVIPKEYLEVDERVTSYVDGEFNDKLQLVERKLAYDLEKSKVQMTKLLNYVTNPADMHPITVKGINNPKVELLTVRQREMTPDFFAMMELVEKKLNEETSKGRPPARQTIVKAVAPKSQKTTALEYFLLSLSPSVIEGKLGPKLHRLLITYRSRREKWDKRSEQWEEFEARKPIQDKNHPDDEKLLAEASKTIGDYKLKESDDYKPPADSRDTTLTKYKEVLDARLKQYKLRHKFIKRVWEIRDLKYVVRQRLLDQLDYLKKVHEDLPPELCKFGPPVPPINEAEFPEKKLAPVVILPEDEYATEMVPVTQQFVKQPDTDEEEKELLINYTSFPPIAAGVFVCPLPKEEVNNTIEADFDTLSEVSDGITAFELEIQVHRLNKKLFDQDLTIRNMEIQIEEFNNVIEEAKIERLPLHVHGNFVDIFLLTLIQELNILKSSEDMEDSLSRKVNQNLKQVHTLEDKIDELSHKKKGIDSQIENFLVEANKIQEKFKHATENNKFYEFLKKVFKKKYKPPKVLIDDESSSESSSSSSSEESDEDDAASIDSRDFGFIRQDLNVCPKGCEVAIYNLTVQLRSNRHEIEHSIRERNRDLDTVKKDLEMTTRRLGVQQGQLHNSQFELENFQREKQKHLNKVTCAVVLNINQVYEFRPETSEITDFVVFSRIKLSNLYKRVGVLEEENYHQKSKFDLYLKHLTRMKKDINYMRQKSRDLKNHFQDLMLKKFGKVVDICELELALLQKSFQKTYVNELEEVVLKKLVYDLRLGMNDIRQVFIAELNNWNSKIGKAQEELSGLIKGNTMRLELLRAITKEKNQLVKIVAALPKKRLQILKIEESQAKDSQDLEKLESLLEGQFLQLHQLKSEIKMLKTKGLPPTPLEKEITETPVEKKQLVKGEEEEEEEEAMKEWGEYDKYIEEEIDISEAREKPFTQEIKIPGYYSTESEDLVTDLLKELLEGLHSGLVRSSAETTVRAILGDIINCTSITEIVREIIKNLPFELSEKQMSAVEVAAGRLFSIQEPEGSDDSFTSCAKELIENTIDEVMFRSGDAYEDIVSLVQALVESIPAEYLMRKESIDLVVKKLSETLGSVEIDKESMAKAVESIPSFYKKEMLPILDVILERVFGQGLDYLYVIKYD